MALNVFTAATAKTGSMSGTLDTVRVLVTEVRTESATAEVALWTISISVAAYVGAVGAGRKARARGADALSAAHGWGAMRFAALLAMFALVTVQASAAGWLTGADAATLDWSLAHRFGAVTLVAVVITQPASPLGLAVIAVASAALVSWRRRSWAPGILIVGTVAAAAAASTITTMIVGRSRPPATAELVTGVDWSYPSEHVTGIVALAGALWVVYGARVRTTSVRVGVGAAVVFVVTVVTGTVLYLGACWLTDVFAGVLLGAAVATAASVVAKVFTVRHLPAAFVPTDDLLSQDNRRPSLPGESGYRAVESRDRPRTSAGIDQVISCPHSQTDSSIVRSGSVRHRPRTTCPPWSSEVLLAALDGAAPECLGPKALDRRASPV